jgi:hypothetical protein
MWPFINVVVIIRLCYLPGEFMAFTWSQNCFINVTTVALHVHTFLFVSIQIFSATGKLESLIFLRKESRSWYELCEYR